MAGYVLLGALAAFGMLSALWALLCFLLPAGRKVVTVCCVHTGIPEAKQIRRCRRLWDLGLVRWTLILVDMGLSPEERKWLEATCPFGEICSQDMLAERLKMERDRIE